MKIFISFIFIVNVLLPIQIFSQEDYYYEHILDSLLHESINPILKSVEQPKQNLHTENFKDSRTLINRKILENGFLLIEILYQGNSVYNGWVDISKTTFTYDVNVLVEKQRYVWENYYWETDGKWTYIYDGNNNVIEELYQDLISGYWENISKFTFTYDTNNNVIEELYQVWNGSNWTISWKYSYAYDMNNNIIQKLKQTWNGSNWVNSVQTIFQYDENNNMIEELNQEWSGSEWLNDLKKTCTYDSNNYKIEELWQNWNSSNWVDYLNLGYTYDINNNLIESIWQIWENTTWVNYRKYTYSYNGNNIRTETIYFAWWATVWIKDTRWIYTYDANNNKIEERTQDWNGGYWLDLNRSIYSYILTDVNEITSEINYYSLSNNYPNPFNPVTSIQYAVSNRQFVTLKVYDVLGNEIAILVNEEKQPGTYEVEFNTSSTKHPKSSGIYFYQLKAGNYAETKKMVLLK